MVHKCMMLAVQKRTSKHIQARQCSDCNGKYPVNDKYANTEMSCDSVLVCIVVDKLFPMFIEFFRNKKKVPKCDLYPTYLFF